MTLARKNIHEVTPYVAGKPIDETRRELRLKEVIKLASNENPLGPSPLAVKAILKELKNLNRYPDSNSFYLKKRLSHLLGLEPTNILLGNGSDEIIDIIVKTFVESGQKILTSENSFLEYEILSAVLNRKTVKVPLKYFKYDLLRLKRAIDKDTKVIFIANPNNPTGTYVNRFELEEFLKNIPENVLVVLDEAYDIFIDVNDFPQSLSLIKNKNVIVLKTFSKSYGLAGLRIGYALARPELIAFMERARQPFNVNSLAQAGALAALEDKNFLKKTRETVFKGKRFICSALKEMGIAYVASVANFVLIDVEKSGVEVFKQMLRYGVIVRDMQQYGLKNYIRVSIGSKKENERFIKVLKKVLRGGGIK